MILPDLVLPSRANHHWLVSGMDNLPYCNDKIHYLRYPHRVEYHYNSRGFRDAEWPQNLDDSILCLGDSFTVGIGQPQNHIWPSRLQTATGRRTVNISKDGARNDWIARRAKDLVSVCKPRAMIVMWSYLHRREDPDCSKHDEDRRMHHVRKHPESWVNSTEHEDLENFLSCLRIIRQLDVPQIHFSIPGCFAVYKDQILPDECNHVIKVSQLDVARDGHHFDVITADWVVKQVVDRLDP